MIVIGIDPGLAHTGYGVISAEGSRYKLIRQGVVATPPSDEPGKRLQAIYSEIIHIVREYGPEQAGVESLYFAKNSSSAIPVAQARGVVLLALAQSNVKAKEYPPQAIKQAIVGNGRAEKNQVQELVRLLLGLHAIPQPDHAADALAAAICHFNNLETPIKS